MSSSANHEVSLRPESTRERRTSIGRAFKRIRTALQKITSSNKVVQSQPQHNSTQDTAPLDALVADNEPEDLSQILLESSRSIEFDTNFIKDETGASAFLSPNPPALIRDSVHRERTRALFAKYGLSVEAREWIPSPPLNQIVPRGVLRVEKPIRMRIRYTCHLCHTMFGTAKQCRKCQHRRCLSCPREPPRRPRNEEEDKENNIVVATDHSDEDNGDRWTRRTKKVRSREGTPGPTSRSSSAGPLPVVQRTRRTCHQCTTEFPVGTAQICTKCGHLRCSKCPRGLESMWSCGREENEGNDGDTEPSRKTERIYRKPRQRIRWVCDQCSTTYLEGSQICRDCLHKRCDFCTRIPPKRLKGDLNPDAEVVRSVERRLANLTIPGDATSPALRLGES